MDKQLKAVAGTGKSEMLHPMVLGVVKRGHQWVVTLDDKVMSKPFNTRSQAMDKLKEMRNLALKFLAEQGSTSTRLYLTEDEKEEAAKKRPANYNELSPQEQWDIDKQLGILDWEVLT